MTHDQFVSALLAACNLDPEILAYPEAAILTTVNHKIAEFDARIRAAQDQVDRWREAAEAEHTARLEAEHQRDALLNLMVGPGVGLHAGCWVLTSPAQADATMPRIWPTREAAVRAVYRAAGVEVAR